MSNERRRRELEVLSAADRLVRMWDRLGPVEQTSGEMLEEPTALLRAVRSLRAFEDEEAENERLVELERRLARRRRGGQAGLGRVPVRPRCEAAAVTPRTRTAGSSPSTDSRQDDAEQWVSWGPRWRWHRMTGRGEQIVTACGAWTWAATPTNRIIGYPGAGACRKCARKRVGGKNDGGYGALALRASSSTPEMRLSGGVLVIDSFREARS